MKPNYDIKRIVQRFEERIDMDIDFRFEFRYDEQPYWDEGEFYVSLFAEYRGEEITRQFSTVKAFGELQWHLKAALHDIKNDYRYLEYMGYFDEEEREEDTNKDAILGENQMY